MHEKDLIDANMQFAKSAVDNGDYPRAVMYLRLTAIGTLELAKNSFGYERSRLYNKSSEIMSAVEQLEKKIESGVVIRKSDAAIFDDNSNASDMSGNSNRLSSGSNAGSSSNGIAGSSSSGIVGNSNNALGKNATYVANSQGNNVGGAIRPQRLSDFLGQPQAVKAVKDCINAAKLRHAPLQHVLMYGSHGLGKTTFARIIASELGVNFVEINVAKLNSIELIKVLTSLKDRDIIFIDEIHNLPKETAESVLYSAMEDFRVSIVEKDGDKMKSTTIQLPRFTLIGATTEAGDLPKPLLSRVQIQCRLMPYTDEVLAQIIKKSFSKVGMNIELDCATSVAKRCRDNPRIANRCVSRIADKALCDYAERNNSNFAEGSLGNIDNIARLNIQVEQTLVNEYFEENGIDELGLEEGDRTFLRKLIIDFEGRPTSIDTVARAMNESLNVVKDNYESYLLRCGMIAITSGGRVATKRAHEHLGVPYNGEDEVDAISESDNVGASDCAYCGSEPVGGIVEPSCGGSEPVNGIVEPCCGESDSAEKLAEDNSQGDVEK